MKHFLKVFISTAMVLGLIVGTVSYGYVEFIYDNSPIKLSDLDEYNEELKTKKSDDRVNMLIVGRAGQLTDTIVLGSYDLEGNRMDMISIPRDTYFDSGYSGASMKKINSVYANEGIKGTIEAVEELLEIEDKISYYAEIDYEGVENIVDSVGGVEVDVPQNMYYSDPKASPPLYINIRKGSQVLDGEKSVEFLRYRSGYSDGDLGRVNAQQEFIKSFIDSALSTKLPNLIKTTISEVETNIDLTDAIRYSTDLVKLRPENIQMHTLPGEAEYMAVDGTSLSYFFVEEGETTKLIDNIMD